LLNCFRKLSPPTQQLFTRKLYRYDTFSEKSLTAQAICNFCVQQILLQLQNIPSIASFEDTDSDADVEEILFSGVNASDGSQPVSTYWSAET